MSAGFAEFAGPRVGAVFGKGDVNQFTARMLVGALSSKLGGGSYENGAMTAAFGYLFNCVAHQCNAADYDLSDPKTHYSPLQSSPVLCNTSSEGCLELSRRALSCSSAPGQNGCTAIGETRSYVLTGGNPITQYRPNADTIINGTSADHLLHDGMVVRHLSISAAGDVTILTWGVGTNSSIWTAALNRVMGPMLFDGVGGRNARAVQQCLKGVSGPRTMTAPVC